MPYFAMNSLTFSLGGMEGIAPFWVMHRNAALFPNSIADL